MRLKVLVLWIRIALTGIPLHPRSDNVTIAGVVRAINAVA